MRTNIFLGRKIAQFIGVSSRLGNSNKRVCIKRLGRKMAEKYSQGYTVDLKDKRVI